MNAAPIRTATVSGGYLRRALLRRFVAGGPPLEKTLGALELRAARRAEVSAAAVEEILNHPDARPDPLRRDILARHRSRNLSRRPLECARRRMRGVGRHASNPSPSRRAPFRL